MVAAGAVAASALAACSSSPSWSPAVGAGPSGSSLSTGAAPGGGAGGAASCNDAEIDAILALTPDLDVGQEQFNKSCALQPCHGDDGVNGNGPDFNVVLPQYDDCGLMAIMLDGKSGMISLTMVFDTDQNFRDALAYVRAEF